MPRSGAQEALASCIIVTFAFIQYTLTIHQPSSHSKIMAESSLAADLLADFNESENEDDDFGIENGVSHPAETNGQGTKSRDFMELDGDEEADNGEDEDMKSIGLQTTHGGSELADDDDEEVRKAKVEKMQLGNVDDVRSVAGLMKVLEPVLEVSFTEKSHLFYTLEVLLNV